MIAGREISGFLARWERDEADATIGHNRRNGDMVSIE
jgi:hypothetical protein